MRVEKRFQEPSAKAVHVLLGCALCVFVSGCLVYLLGRPPLPPLVALGWRVPFAERHALLGSLGQCFPSFAHSYSFTLITVVVLGFRTSHIIAASVGWMAIESLFEIGQHPVPAQWFAELATRRGVSGRLLQGLVRYFATGTFDAFDLLAAALGVGFGVATVFILKRGGRVWTGEARE